MADDSNPERAERILDAACDLITHYGYGKTTVSDIAQKAGVSKGAIYLHWSSKEDLFEALIFRESLRVLDDTLQRIEADADNRTFFSLYQHAILATMQNPLMLAIMTRDMRVLGDFARRWSKTGVNLEGQAVRLELVRELQDVGVIRTDFSTEVIGYIFTLIRYGFITVEAVVPGDQIPPLEEVARAIGLILDRGLSPEGGGNREAGKAVLIRIVEMMRTMIEGLRKTGT